MRLIDVDKYLEKVCTYKETGCGSCKLQTMCPKDAPTVEAIPSEWIKNYARHKASKGFTEIDCYWQSWEEDVLKMVADWEEENEAHQN